MSILSNQTPRDLEKHPVNEPKKTGTPYDTCFSNGTYNPDLNCAACPQKVHCSWYTEMEVRKLC